MRLLTLILSSANPFNLYMAKILLSDKGLAEKAPVSIFFTITWIALVSWLGTDDCQQNGHCSGHKCVEQFTEGCLCMKEETMNEEFMGSNKR